MVGKNNTTTLERNPLQDYLKFIFVGYKAIGIKMQDIAAVGGVEKFRSVLHDKAAEYLLLIDGLPYNQENFDTARNRIKEIVNNIDKYPPEGGMARFLK